MGAYAARYAHAPHDRRELVGVSLFGTALHLAMDTLNSYGVHPFWPFRDQWMYGDSVFIVEPLYWAATAPLIFVVRSWAARIILGVALLAGVAASLLPVVPPLPRVGFLILTVALLAVGSRISARSAALVSASVTVLITVTFIGAGYAAARRVETIARTELGGARVIDHVLTPLPMNPLCWDVLLLLTDGDRYSVPSMPCWRKLQGCFRRALVPSCPETDPRLLRWSRSRPRVPQTSAGSVNSRCRAPTGRPCSDPLRGGRAHAVRARPVRCRARTTLDHGRPAFRWRSRGRYLDDELGPPEHGGCGSSVPWVPPRLDLLTR